VVVGQRVLVVDRIQQPFVADEQQCHPGSLVDPATLGLDDAVLDLVAHAQAVPSADFVGLHDQRHLVVEVLTVDGDRVTLIEGHGDDLGLDLDGGVPELHAHDRFDRLHRDVQALESLGLVGGAPDIRVGGVRLLLGVAVRQTTFGEPLAHLVASAQLGDEIGVEPRLVDAQLGIGHQAVAVEPLDVVALVGRPVAPDRDIVLSHRLHQHGAGDRSADRGGVEVVLARRDDVERAALQGEQALFHQGRPAVHQARDLGAVGQRAAGHRIDVGLVVLADVGGVGAGDRTFLAHPRHRNGGIEAAREGDADAFAGGK